jgi:hypothetical protein
MKLLVVVDKLLTGFDAPPCTYLYIDKSMQDHGLFQAICRTNRLDGEYQDSVISAITRTFSPRWKTLSRPIPRNWATVRGGPPQMCS